MKIPLLKCRTHCKHSSYSYRYQAQKVTTVKCRNLPTTNKQCSMHHLTVTVASNTEHLILFIRELLASLLLRNCYLQANKMQTFNNQVTYYSPVHKHSNYIEYRIQMHCVRLWYPIPTLTHTFLVWTYVNLKQSQSKNSLIKIKKKFLCIKPKQNNTCCSML